MDGSNSPTSADFSKVVDLATLHALLPIGQVLSGWKTGPTITGTLLHGNFLTCLQVSQIVSLSLFLSIWSSSFVFLRLVIIADLVLWALTLFAQTNICSLVTAVFFLSFGEASNYFCWHIIVIEPVYEFLLQLFIYLLIVTLYSYQSRSAHPFFCILICLSA